MCDVTSAENPLELLKGVRLDVCHFVMKIYLFIFHVLEYNKLHEMGVYAHMRLKAKFPVRGGESFIVYLWCNSGVFSCMQRYVTTASQKMFSVHIFPSLMKVLASI